MKMPKTRRRRRCSKITTVFEKMKHPSVEKEGNSEEADENECRETRSEHIHQNHETGVANGDRLP